MPVLTFSMATLNQHGDTLLPFYSAVTRISRTTKRSQDGFLFPADTTHQCSDLASRIILVKSNSTCWANHLRCLFGSASVIFFSLYLKISFYYYYLLLLLLPQWCSGCCGYRGSICKQSSDYGAMPSHFSALLPASVFCSSVSRGDYEPAVMSITS